MKIVIQNLQKKIPINPKKIKESVLKVLQIERIKKIGQINFFFVSDPKIRELNLRYQGKGYATDVLSFDISRSSKDKILADIFISVDRAVCNAKIFKTTLEYEICLYCLHGLLHFLGYDDKTKKDKFRMRKKEESLLKILNLSPPPYRQAGITYHA